MQSDHLKQILQDVAESRQSIDEAFNQIKNLPYEDLGFAKVDHHRIIRQGLPEVIFGQNKTADQIESIIQAMRQHKAPILVTRIQSSIYEIIQQKIPELEYHELAQLAYLNAHPLPKVKGEIVILCAGTSDLPVGYEAQITSELMGNPTCLISDVGVAGIHRLFAHKEKLDQASVIVVIAGMEGALASVVGGLTHAPIIAVPTSVGYGMNLQGMAPLLTMLNSCAPSVSVVNVDNGFGAAYSASLINKKTGFQEG